MWTDVQNHPRLVQGGLLGAAGVGLPLVLVGGALNGLGLALLSLALGLELTRAAALLLRAADRFSATRAALQAATSGAGALLSAGLGILVAGYGAVVLIVWPFMALTAGH